MEKGITKGGGGTKRFKFNVDGVDARYEETTADPNPDDKAEQIDGEVVYERFAKSNEPCAGCTYELLSRPAKRGEDPAHDTFYERFESSKLEMAPPKLAEMIYNMYLNLFVGPGELLHGKTYESWSKASILRHLSGLHGIDERTDVANRIRRLTVWERVYEDSVAIEVEGDKIRMNDKRVETALKVSKEKDRLYDKLRELNTTTTR